MIIEIGYEFQSDKDSPVQTSWTYFYVKGDDIAKAKTKAKAYWNKFITDLGWTKKTKLVHIEEIQNGKTYTPDYIIVARDELPPARSNEGACVLPGTRTRNAKSSSPRTRRKSSTSRVKTGVQKGKVRNKTDRGKDSDKTSR